MAYIFKNSAQTPQFCAFESKVFNTPPNPWCITCSLFINRVRIICYLFLLLH